MMLSFKEGEMLTLKSLIVSGLLIVSFAASSAAGETYANLLQNGDRVTSSHSKRLEVAQQSCSIECNGHLYTQSCGEREGSCNCNCYSDPICACR